jgi:polyhydroxybutyrate depolymerase
MAKREIKSLNGLVFIESNPTDRCKQRHGWIPMKSIISPLLIAITLLADKSECLEATRDRQQIEWTIEGERRTAVIKPAENTGVAPAPVVFGWHGHGGTSAGCERWGLETMWPEAIFVYAQGLPTSGRLTDPEGKKSGWQFQAGAMRDRDLKLFDTILADLRGKFSIDETRIYSTGHSNGGGMTYLVAEQRPGVFAAIAPCASAKLRRGASGNPIPVLHILGENDPLVKPEWQWSTIEALKQINRCTSDPVSWGSAGVLSALIYQSSNGSPMVVATHRGGHEYPKGAAELIVRFFKEHALHKK